MWFQSLPGVGSLVPAKLVALVVNGLLQSNELRSEKVTAAETLRAVDSVGFLDFSDVAAMVLETIDASSDFSTSRYRSGSALEGVLTFPESRAH